MEDKEALAKKVFLEFYSSFILDDEIEETGRVFYLAQKASIVHLNLIRGILQYDEYIINMRFDVFSNSNSISETQIIDLIDQNYDKVFLKNVFLYNNLAYSCLLQFGILNSG